MYSNYSQQLPEAWRDVSEMFVALGDEQRQRILLTFEPGERLNVTQIVSASALTRTTVSHHLKGLRQAGALRSEKGGKEVYFWVDKDNILQVLQCVQAYIQQQT